jgi:hypothetical protein
LVTVPATVCVPEGTLVTVPATVCVPEGTLVMLPDTGCVTAEPSTFNAVPTIATVFEFVASVIFVGKAVWISAIFLLVQ